MNTDGQTTLDLWMTPEEMLVWAIVRRRHGKAAAILGTDIAARTGIKYKRVQEIVSHLASNAELWGAFPSIPHERFVGRFFGTP